MTLPTGWLCPCCKCVVSPALGICPLCNQSSQMNDDVRATHDCPIWGPTIDAFFRRMSEGVARGENPAPLTYQVPQRPHIS